MHFFAVDAIHAIDACNVEQFRAVRISLHVQLLVGSCAGIIPMIITCMLIVVTLWPWIDRCRLQLCVQELEQFQQQSMALEQIGVDVLLADTAPDCGTCVCRWMH